MKQPSDIYIEQYRIAAGEGAIVELKLRLLADKVPELQQYAHAQRLEDIEVKVVEHFDDVLREEDKKTLALCRQLRNKILHCSFQAARDTLAELGFEVQRSGVRKINVQDLSALQITETIPRVLANIEGTFEYVSDIKITDPGNVYGWLMEMGSAGAFRQAAEAFKKSVQIVDQLLGHTSNASN
jgi:hypothetical protein